MAEKGMTIEEIATIIRKSRSSVVRRLSGYTPWTSKDLLLLEVHGVIDITVHARIIGNPESIGNLDILNYFIKARMNKLGWSITYLAATAGISRATARKALKGKRFWSIQELAKIERTGLVRFEYYPAI